MNLNQTIRETLTESANANIDESIKLSKSTEVEIDDDVFRIKQTMDGKSSSVYLTKKMINELSKLSK